MTQMKDNLFPTVFYMTPLILLDTKFYVRAHTERSVEYIVAVAKSMLE